MAVDLSTYKSYEECRTTLLRMGASSSEVEEILEHEREHYDEAVELGYLPVYGIRMVVERPPIILTGFIEFEGRVPDGQDMIDILLAPEKPGEHDYKLADKIRAELAQQ